jgi:predicted MFS family arabinose efflux permease
VELVPRAGRSHRAGAPAPLAFAPRPQRPACHQSLRLPSAPLAVGNLATVTIYAALAVGSLVIVIYLQQGIGLSATLAGLVLLPVTIFNIALSSWFGTLAGRYGPRWFMAGGPALASVGFLLMLAIDEPFDFVTQALPGVLLFGLGLTMTIAPLTSAILGAIDPRQSGIASATNNAVSRVAGLIAIAVLGLVIGTEVDGAWFDRALILCAALLAAGAITSAIGIRNEVVPDDEKVSAENR